MRLDCWWLLIGTTGRGLLATLQFCMEQIQCRYMHFNQRKGIMENKMNTLVSCQIWCRTRNLYMYTKKLKLFYTLKKIFHDSLPLIAEGRQLGECMVLYATAGLTVAHLMTFSTSMSRSLSTITVSGLSLVSSIRSQEWWRLSSWIRCCVCVCVRACVCVRVQLKSISIKS